MRDERVDIDLGDNHTLRFYGWFPDRELNPHYAGIPDLEKAGATVSHLDMRDTTKVCMSGVMFRSAAHAGVFNERTTWGVVSWEPLTLAPSLLCLRCGDHGFIRNSKWERV